MVTENTDLVTKKGNGVLGWLINLGIVLTLLIVGAIGLRTYEHITAGLSPINASSAFTGDMTAARIALVDSERLLRARIAMDISNRQDMRPEAFNTQLKAEVARLVREGMIVMNANNVMAYPGGIDHTEEIARNLKLDLTAARDYVKTMSGGPTPTEPAAPAGIKP